MGSQATHVPFTHQYKLFIFNHYGLSELDALMHKAEIIVVAVEAEHVAEARRAHRRFGKGRHAAGLNFGDVCAYALARMSGEPLLCKGDDLGSVLITW